MPAYILWVKSLSHVRLFATPWTVAFQAPSSVGFSRQEYWSGLPFPSPGDLPNPGIEPWPPTLQADALPPWTLWDEKPIFSALHGKLENEGEKKCMCLSSVQFSRSVVSDSLRPYGLQQARLSSPSSTPGACSNSCALSWWCHPTILSSVIPFSSCPQSFPASRSSPMSQLFMSGGQSIGVSASTSVLPVNTQDWSPLGWTV